MRVEHSADRPEVTRWEAGLLRMTAFPGSSTNVAEPSWWEGVVGASPESRIARPKASVTEERGPFAGGQLTLMTQPGRIDWVYAIEDEQSRERGGWPTLGPFPSALEHFRGPMLTWLASAPPARRLAFGAVLLQPISDRPTGYRRLSVYLPYVQLDPDCSSDFSYQINRPRPSKVDIPGLGMNRLCKWSVSVLDTRRLRVDKAVVQADRIETHVACNLELDMSTAADFEGELEGQRSEDVFSELVGLGVEIATEGDCP